MDNHGRNAMTNRERLRAVIRGEETDRFPVWLKMANRTWQNPQPEPYRSLPADQLLSQAGCDLMVGIGLKVTRDTPHARTAARRVNGLNLTTVTTPDGALTGADRHDPYTDSWHPSEYMVRDAEDLRRLRWLFKDAVFSVEADKAAEAKAQSGRWRAADAFTIQGIGPSPLMSLVEQYCGPENTIYLMTDEPALFAEILEEMHRCRMRELKALLPFCAADTFWLTENTSTSLISPRMFKDHAMRYLREYAELVQAHQIVAVHHMCGKLNALLELLDSLPAQVNEAYTTRPLGDVSLAEGRRRMPSKSLWGGTNATLWLEPVEKIAAEVAADLARCPDRRRIFLTSAGVLPPAVNFEKARRVVEEFKRL